MKNEAENIMILYQKLMYRKAILHISSVDDIMQRNRKIKQNKLGA